MSAEPAPAELLDRVQQLSDELDALPDSHARELAQQLVSAVIAMYGDGLARIMEAITRAREAGETIIDELAQDGAVASLLLIHDLYPISLEDRVREALDTVRPYMESHGGNVELVALESGVARLALRGSCNGCAASRATLELAIKQALDEHAPDLVGIDVEGVSDPPDGQGNGFELPMVHTAGGRGATVEHPPSRWVTLDRAAEPPPGELRPIQIDGTPLLLASIDGALLAYRDACAACGERLHDGALDGPMLQCRRCSAEFDLRLAGRAAGGEPLQLTPVPLLEAGGVRIAV